MSVLEACLEWVRTLDLAWLFLVILPVVILVVGLWSRGLNRLESGERETED